MTEFPNSATLVGSNCSDQSDSVPICVDAHLSLSAWHCQEAAGIQREKRRPELRIRARKSVALFNPHHSNRAAPTLKSDEYEYELSISNTGVYRIFPFSCSPVAFHYETRGEKRDRIAQFVDHADPG